jgi:hypothetical protein
MSGNFLESNLLPFYFDCSLNRGIMSIMSKKNKEILFWAPTMGTQKPWLEYTFNQALSLAQMGHDVRCVLSDRYGALSEARQLAAKQTELPASLRLIEMEGEPPTDILQRKYDNIEAVAIKQWIYNQPELEDFLPDTIVVRGANAPYLMYPYPNVPRFNLIEGTLPGLTATPTDAILALDEDDLLASRLWGSPIFEKTWAQQEYSLPVRSPEASVADLLYGKVRAQRLTPEQANVMERALAPKLAGQRLFDNPDTGRGNYYLFPCEFISPEMGFSIEGHTLCGNQRANLEALLGRTGEAPVLVTYHPRDVALDKEGNIVVSPSVPENMRPDALRASDSRIIIPGLNPSLKHIDNLTGRLVSCALGMGWQASKTWLTAYIDGTPMVDLSGGAGALNFVPGLGRMDGRGHLMDPRVFMAWKMTHANILAEEFPARLLELSNKARVSRNMGRTSLTEIYERPREAQLDSLRRHLKGNGLPTACLDRAV